MPVEGEVGISMLSFTHISELFAVVHTVCVLQPLPPIVFLHGRNSYATILPKLESSSGTWNHLAIVTAEVTLCLVTLKDLGYWSNCLL